ncbi:MAG TPA: indolepyruvate ferredoxin oxidoreductase family protein [Solirubrobacterales bacterium]|jgi:indolepyruvate ferredoxin oxidoreductase|nr:indolepyruvate ferredoxin oxidoreductase family protein [Solirubrobacterales bacterium]
MAADLQIHRRELSLDDRYTLDEGQAFMSGVQALVRVLIDQHRADTREGLRTAAMVSGYQGSPLGGFDREVARLRAIATENEIHHQPAVNEELGATAVWGSQIAGTLPGPRFDGVLGVWYGKAPGVDRSADAIRHGNFVGTDPKGGVLALCGDDPACKSSTIPGASESILASLQVPTLVPGSVQEAVDLGRHAVACSRASGLWSAMKVVTNVADGTETVRVGLERVQPVVPQLEFEGRPYVHQPSPHLLAPQSLDMERTLIEVRLELAREYARLNRLNRVIHESRGATIGVVAAGATAHDVLRSLADLGLDEEGPVRVLQLGMIYPLERESLREFAAGVEEIVVVEEKASFLERLVKDALYGAAAAPPVLGKRDDSETPLVPAYGTLDSDAISTALARRVLARHDLPHVRARLDQLQAIAARPEPPMAARRTPFFCSGCPHNTSTAAEDDAIVGAGIGCHTMVMLSGAGHGKVTGITQMGGEGAQWIGIAPFVGVDHFVQNLGDGTFHHSGSLAIRAAVAAKLNITYKLLFNGTVAMTGGQHVEGEMAVPEAVAGLASEGVARIIITTEEPERYRGVTLPAIAEVRSRDEMLAVQRDLAAVEGVTVLLHDQACAAELRRARKRGKAPEPPERVFINPLVCEGCGDCGEKSGCLSVEPIETEFGRRTAINQASCNKDFSCLKGDCPSFVTLIEDGAKASAAPAALGPDVELPEPERAVVPSTRVRLVGIGGTGVVTVSQVLGVAAMLDGRHATGLDQTGLSQKAGPVISDMRITSEPVLDGVTVPAGTVDVILGLDPLGSSTKSALRVAASERTVAVVSESVSPTGRMIVDVNAAAAEASELRTAIDAVTDKERNVYLDARAIAERFLGDEMPENVVVLGAALQAGLLPVSLESLRQAFRLNGVAIDQNLAALDWGRAWVAAPDTIARGLRTDEVPPSLDAGARALVERAAGSDSPALRRTVEIRVADLLGWGGRRPAERYADFVERVRLAEEGSLSGDGELAEAAARGMHKLLAYKDEYEVARLQLKGLDALPAGSKLRFHLHPPLLRAMGMKRKLKLGPWFVPAFRVLRAGRVVRGTPLDPFGYARVRRTERELPDEYAAAVEAALAELGPQTRDTALEIARLPELVRGYEEIKLDGVRRFRDRSRELLEELRTEPVVRSDKLAA